MQSQTAKIILAVLTTAVIVGGGVYYWQQQRAVRSSATQNVGAETEKKNVDKTVLYTDETYGLKFRTTERCKDYFFIKSNDPDENSTALIGYAVYVPISKSWPAGSPWFGYAIYTQEEYNKFNPYELPGQPVTILALDSEKLLTRWDPQDLPGDVAEDCGLDSIVVEKL